MNERNIFLINNLEQAKHYIKNQSNIKGNCAIIFNFPSEELFINKNIEFESSDDFEYGGLYPELYFSSMNSLEKFCKAKPVYHKGINIMEIIKLDLFPFFHLSQRYLKIIEAISSIKKNEKINIYDFKQDISDVILLRIAKNIFGERLNVIPVNIKRNDFYFFFILSFFQKIISNSYLSFLRSKKKKIFFSGSRDLFDDLLKEMIFEGKFSIFRFGDSIQRSFILNGRYIPFYQFLKNCKTKLRTIDGDISKIDFVWELGVNKNLSKILNEEISLFLKKRLPEIISVIEETIFLAEKNKINLVILDNSVEPFKQSIIEVCKNFKIPTIVLQHGTIVAKEGFLPLNSDFIAVWGKNSKKQLVKWGVNRKKIMELGSPKYARFFSSHLKEKDSKNILYILDAINNLNTIPGVHLTKKMQKETFTKLFRTIKKFPDYHLIIKTRPGCEMNNLPKIIAKKENFNNFEIIEKTDNLQLIDNVDVVITSHSSMGIEAIIRKKPLISLSFKELDKFNFYKEIIPKRVVYSEAGLKDNLVEAIKNNGFPEEKKVIKDNFNYVDGRDSKRIMDFMKKVMKNQIFSNKNAMS
jgi:hypothetical protein